MRKNKKLIFIVILLLGIGFAAVSTTLYLNGNVGVTTNDDDFDVRFTEAILNNNEYITFEAISKDGKTINFKASNLSTIGEVSFLVFEIKNYSSMYDANVNISCTSSGTYKDHYIITEEPPNEIPAKKIGIGNIQIELIKNATENIKDEFSCTLNATAKERTTIQDPIFIPKYFEFGTPTTNSTKNYRTLGKNVFASLGDDGITEGICIIKNTVLVCIEANNYSKALNSLKKYFTTNQCSYNMGYSCSTNVNGESIYCYAGSTGDVSCMNSTHTCKNDGRGTIECKNR